MQLAWRRRALLAGAIFLFYSAIGLLSFAYKYLDFVACGVAVQPLRPLLEELTGAYGGALLLPAFVWVARRFRPTRRAWAGPLLAHAGACLLSSFLHTSWNGASRMLLFPLFGLGPYDYGVWSVRYFMEAPNDVVVYIFTMSAIYLLLPHLDGRFPTAAEPLQPAPPPASPQHLLVRSKDRALLLPFAEIDWVQAAGNYLEVRARGKTHLVRGSLTALEDRLAPERFLRLNRSQIVRVDFIRELQPWLHGEYKVALKDGTTLNWTRRFRDRTRDLVLENL